MSLLFSVGWICIVYAPEYGIYDRHGRELAPKTIGTMLLRLFIHELPHNRYHPVYLHLTPLNANAFLRLIVTKLGEKPMMGKDRMLLQILERINLNDKCTLFIIDEAHLIDPKILTDLRLLISSIDEDISEVI